MKTLKKTAEKNSVVFQLILLFIKMKGKRKHTLTKRVLPERDMKGIKFDYLLPILVEMITHQV
jgi:hypothetical protein